MQIKSGTLDAKKGKLEGHFKIDMTTIVVLDVEKPETNKKLVNHLKDTDFFNVSKFPESTLKIKKAVPEKEKNQYQVTGLMTIKGIAKEIVFPATVVTKDDGLTANAKFTIDRTRWDIRFRSANFFKNLGDKTISNDIEFEVQLKAQKKS